jgi:hypothetical protein
MPICWAEVLKCDPEIAKVPGGGGRQLRGRGLHTARHLICAEEGINLIILNIETLTQRREELSNSETVAHVAWEINEGVWYSTLLPIRKYTIAPTHIIAHVLYSSKNPNYIIKTPRDHVGQKARVRARPSRGVGGMEANTPTHAKWSHATLDTYNRLRAPATLQYILTEQTEKSCWPLSLPLNPLRGMYTALFSIHSVHINLYYLTIFREKPVGPPGIRLH